MSSLWNYVLVSIIIISSILKILFSFEMFQSHLLPIWNYHTRFTRNQSYDIRGDPLIIPPNSYISPWGVSSFF